ncbi:MAG: hypothetical protein EBS91_00235 [Betaproteobacteria bacterium]|nr:hypothetical protein [Betaproteobacteria bacterium]
MKQARSRNGRFKAKPKVCQTCETHRATVLCGFAGYLGAFFVCDDCEAAGVAPKWAMRRRA